MSGLESREYAVGIRGTLYLQSLSLTSPTSGGRSVGIVRSRTQATEFSFSLCTMFLIFTDSVSELHGQRLYIPDNTLTMLGRESL
jgi:hypothetical protein